MHFINNMMLSVDMSGISEEWQTVDSDDREIVIENDLIDTMETGDLFSVGCEIFAENVIFSRQYVSADYVLKRYMSGISELLVHIPTTNTYYLNGVPGSPVPRNETEIVSRKNLESMPDLEVSKKRQNSSVPEHATSITLKIPKSVMDISEVHDIQISPCSLPLKIYSDNSDINDLEKNGIFNSKVIPSIALPYDIGSDIATFNFRCFGTDEQSIRIQFTEIESHGGGGGGGSVSFVTVEFYPNGGEGIMPVQRVAIDARVKLNKQQFTYDGRFFIGWSFTQQPIGGYPTYADGQYVMFMSNEYKNGDTVRLYAVWTA